MLLIQWFQVDWIKIQWIMFGIFIALIALIRIVRRLTRWGSLKNNQVSCETNTFGGLNYEKYSRQNHSTNTLPNTCVITPLSKRGKKNYFLGVSLAQLGTKVFVFDSENALALLNMSKTSVKNIREFAKQHKIGTFVVFDWATAPLIDFLSRANEGFEDTPLNWIFLRPTFQNNSIQKWWKQTPFSNEFFYTFLMGLKRSQQKLTKNCSTSVQEFLNLVAKNPKQEFLLVDAESSWLKKAVVEKNRKLLKEESDSVRNLSFYQFNKGGWSFYRQETVVFGILASALSSKGF